MAASNCPIATVLISASALLACGAQAAEDLSSLTGTIGIEANPVTSRGQLTGCSLNYRAGVQDNVYRKGALVAISGSFNLHLLGEPGNKTIGALLKVGLKQLLPLTTNSVEAPAFAYLASDNGTTARSILADNISDTPGYRLYALKMDKEVFGLLGDVLDGRPFALFYSRTPAGIDVKVPLDSRVVDSIAGPRGLEPVRSDATVSIFRSCFQRLVKELK